MKISSTTSLGNEDSISLTTRGKKTDLFKVTSVIDSFQKLNETMLIHDGDPDVIGTSNPYQFNLYSDLITNPSSVSISEFQKMAYTMPVISAGLTIIKILVLSKIGTFNHKNEKYKDFINDMIDNFIHSKDEINEDVLTSLWAGFYVGEKRYKSDGRYVRIIDIEPRPAQSILFRVDSQGHLKEDGIIQYYFNNLWTGYGNMLAFNGVDQYGQSIPNPYAARGDFDYPWRTVWAQPIGTVIIPKSKCVHFAYKGLDGLTSPYGRSLLRAAYDTYIIGTEMNRITRNAANFKASPVPTLIVDPDQVRNEEGQDTFDQLDYALSNLGDNGAGNPYLLIKGRKDESVWITGLEGTANLSDLVDLNKYIDSKMLLALMLAPELMGLAEHGSNALGEIQHSLLDQIITGIADKIKKDVWIDQIVKPMLQLNFNEQEDFGSFDTKENVKEEIETNLNKLQGLQELGIKIKPETIMSMMDMDKDSIESVNNPVIDNSSMGRGMGAAYAR